MDRARLHFISESIKTFLLSKKSRELLVFLFFLAVSATFWLMQTLHEEYEMEVHIPLTLTDIPVGVVVTTEPPSEISVRVKDRGSSLLNYYFNRSERVVELPFASHDRGIGDDHVLLSHSEVQKLILPKLLPSTRIIAIRPDTLDYYYTRGIEKRVPVTFRGHIVTDPLHYLASVKLDPDTVTVWGSAAMLDSLHNVSTVATNLMDLTESTTRMIPIATQRGIKTKPVEVLVTAEVDFLVDKQVKVPVVGTNFPGGYVLRTFPPTVTVSFCVGSRNYKSITADNFVLTATYEDLIAQKDSLLTLQLRSIPEGVSQVKISPDRVQFLIEQSDNE